MFVYQITPDTLRFLLPALCHLIVEEKSRQILLDMKIQEILYTYLSYHWTVFDSYKKWLDEQVKQKMILNTWSLMSMFLRLKLKMMQMLLNHFTSLTMPSLRWSTPSTP